MIVVNVRGYFRQLQCVHVIFVSQWFISVCSRVSGFWFSPCAEVFFQMRKGNLKQEFRIRIKLLLYIDNDITDMLANCFTEYTVN